MAETLADGVAVLADRYDGWILDIWGTLYDGGALFEGAREVVSRLAERGVPMALLSNSSRQPATVAARMAGLGLPADLFRAVVTPGGETRRYLIDGLDAFHAGLGERVHTFAPNRFADILPGTRFTQVERVEEADWLLNAGLAGEFDTVSLYEDRLAAGVARGLPMICANPDHAVYELGVLKLHAGALAERYEALGGHVRYHGKPHAPVFHRVAELLDIPIDRLLMVGDNRATDIAGAAASGAGSLLLADGIHHERLLRNGTLDETALAAFLAEDGPAPDYVAARLSW